MDPKDDSKHIWRRGIFLLFITLLITSSLFLANRKKQPLPVPHFVVGVQAGHWKAPELPDELANLRRNGAAAAGRAEWEVNLEIAQHVKGILEERGIVVDVLPATIPPDYQADAFVSIHADSNLNEAKHGFKVGAPAVDLSGDAYELQQALQYEYQKFTGLVLDPFVTDNMRYYYAFSWPNNEYDVHPDTPSVIVETGFLTNPRDRAFLFYQPQQVARGIASGIMKYLEQECIQKYGTYCREVAMLKDDQPTLFSPVPGAVLSDLDLGSQVPDQRESEELDQ